MLSEKEDNELKFYVKVIIYPIRYPCIVIDSSKVERYTYIEYRLTIHFVPTLVILANVCVNWSSQKYFTAYDK